jgi:hypothetical protein
VNARELAVELLGLDRRERERLLGELPNSRCGETSALMRASEREVRIWIVAEPAQVERP